MSARRFLVLLEVVVFGLLLLSPTALSRPELPRYHVGAWDSPGNPDDDPDPDIPDGYVDGDDDNWDKSAVKGHETAELGGESGSAGRGAGATDSENVFSRMEIGLGLRLALLLQWWVVLSTLR